MKVSLISPLFNESLLFESHLQDIKSFFSRFPIDIELVLVLPEHDTETIKKTPEIATDAFTVKVLRTKKSDRAEAVYKGLQSATGDILLIFSWDLSIPLAEFFNFIQELVQNPKAQMVLGNRFDPRKRNQMSFAHWHKTLNAMITEKVRAKGLSLYDPLTPFVALRGFDKSLLDTLRLKGWYYTPRMIEWGMRQDWQIEEVSVVSKQSSERQKTSRIPLFKEFLRHLF